ncbi:MAG: ribonuclease PH [Cyanobacteria bacterium P01_H01_bin.15]
MSQSRPEGRTVDSLRPISFQPNFTRHAAGSVLAKCGDTHVLCTATVEPGVPRFLKDSGQGWLTAEYRMLPSATNTRHRRETMKLSGRTQEIQRLIGRSLRAALDLTKLGENTIYIDADVLQADAGTRTTAITGGYVALALAIAKMQEQELITDSPLLKAIAAISVGIIDGEARLDLQYEEDVAAEVDCNIVMNSDLELIEIQGTAEEKSFNRQGLNRLLDLAEKGISELLKAQKVVIATAAPALRT